MNRSLRVHINVAIDLLNKLLKNKEIFLYWIINSLKTLITALILLVHIGNLPNISRHSFIQTLVEELKEEYKIISNMKIK